MEVGLCGVAVEKGCCSIGVLVGNILRGFEGSIATIYTGRNGWIVNQDPKIELVTASTTHINQTIAVIQFQSLLEQVLLSIPASLRAQFVFEGTSTLMIRSLVNIVRHPSWNFEAK